MCDQEEKNEYTEWPKTYDGHTFNFVFNTLPTDGFEPLHAVT